MLAGKLIHRVWIQTPQEVRGATGSHKQIYTDWKEVWASVEPLTPREIFAAQQVASDLTTRIRMRWRDGLNSKMRIRHQRTLGSPTVSDYYDIEGPPVRIDGKSVELWLYCRFRDAQGFRSGDSVENPAPPPETITSDSTVITSDSTEITSDQE